jgi:hypothetical protein
MMRKALTALIVVLLNMMPSVAQADTDDLFA